MPSELRRFTYCRNVSDPIIIFAQPVSTIPLLGQEFSIVSNSPQTRLHSRLNFLAFSSSEQRCSRRLRILTNNEACLSKKHWNRGCLSPRFLGKLFIFLPGLTSFPMRRFLRTFSCPMSHMSTSIALRSQFQLLHFRAESPRCRGRRRFRRFSKPSTKSLF